MTTAEELVRLTRLRVERLHVRLDHLDRTWAGIWKLSAFALLAVPVAFWRGCVWAFLLVVLDLWLIGVSLYLVGVRRSSAALELRDARRELAAFEAEAERERSTASPSDGAPT